MTALEPMDDNERGCIVTTASVAAFEGQIGQLDYGRLEGRGRGDDDPARA